MKIILKGSEILKLMWFIGIFGTIVGGFNFKFHFMPSWIFWVCLVIWIIRILLGATTATIPVDEIKKSENSEPK